jgi:hypothetical protein
MKKLTVFLVFALLVLAAFSATIAQADTSEDDACWGQATKVFAQTGEMGKHASQQEEPRMGLRNLARALYEAGVIDDDSIQSLGAFVADELFLDVAACTE